MNLQKTPVNAAMIGCGDMARHHFRRILANFPGTRFPVVCEPSQAAYEETAELFEDLGRPAPANQPDLERLLAEYAGKLDAVFIITPHKFHHDQARDCLEAGLDVLLEKPMVMSAAEARSLIEVRDRTGRHLVVAFQGSLSPQVRSADRMLRAGEIGALRSIDGQAWQNWNEYTQGTWRQVPELAGGGFFFDTGAHLMNTVSDLAGEPFLEVAAWLDNMERPVDIMGVVIGRLQSGTLVTLNACGDSFPACESEIRLVGTGGMLRTGMWGGFLDIRRSAADDWTPVPVPASLGVWEQFLAVRAGAVQNPSPPEIGLRMANLWDAIRASAAQDGRPVRIRA